MHLRKPTSINLQSPRAMREGFVGRCLDAISYTTRPLVGASP